MPLCMKFSPATQRKFISVKSKAVCDQKPRAFDRQVLLIKVTRTRYFAAKATVWLSPGNHNHLRITRILRCLSLLGLEAEARAFFECLSEIYENEQSQPRPAISTETILYWRGAVR